MTMQDPEQDGGTITLRLDHRPGGAIAHLAIDHPRRRNAIGPAVIAALAARCSEIAANEDIRLVTLSGRGTTFASGANVKVMAGLDASGARAFITSLGDAIEAFRTLPVPSIAILRGHCLGAAMELAAACDMRIADPTLVAGMPEVRVGIPSVIQASLLPRLVGWGRTSELLFTGRTFGAEDARTMGFVQAIADDPWQTAMAWADDILACEPGAIRAQKQVMLGWNPDAAAGHAASIDAFAACFETGAAARALAKVLR